MKKILTLLVYFIVAANCFAQAPQSISYQAIVRKSNNSLVISAPVSIKISILQGSSSGLAMYVETHNSVTDATGMVVLQIGRGTIVSGIFTSINWALGPFYIKTETDPDGGSNYSIAGTSQLMSVPYAFNAANGNNAGSATGAMKYWNGTAWVSVEPGEHGQTLIFCNGVPTWGTCSTINLRPNVYVVDTTILRLNYDTALINNYKFEFNIISGIPDYKVNDYIVVVEEGGYIVKINSITNTPGKVLYATEQASMSDVIDKGNFSFSIDSENLTQSRTNSTTANGFTFPLNNITLINSTALFFKLNSGSISFNPTWDFDFDFDFLAGGLQNFELGCKDAVLDAKFDVTIKSTLGAPLYDKTDTLGRMKPKYFFYRKGKFPMLIRMDVLFLSTTKVKVAAVTNKELKYSSKSTISMGLKYNEATGWNSNHDFKTLSNVTRSVDDGRIAMDLDFYVYPKVSFRIFNVVGPYLTAGPGTNFNCNINSLTDDSNLSIYTFLDTHFGVNASILKKQLFDYSLDWRSDSLEFHTPYTINRVSGDNQHGKPNLYLPQPVKVKVVDNFGNPEINIPVYFTVTNGGGSVLDPVVKTDKDGYAQTLWKLGDQITIHRLDAAVKKADGTLIKNAPVDFAATFEVELPTVTTDLVKDITSTTVKCICTVVSEGGSPVTTRGLQWSRFTNDFFSKTIDGAGQGSYTSSLTGLDYKIKYYVRAYATNSFGTSYGAIDSFTTLDIMWAPKNLNVATYRNGDTIPEVTSDWGGQTTGAWCHYDNNPANDAIYGKLYNWYAVNDPRGLAPTGWHVSSDYEWRRYIDTLGGMWVAGGKMKSLTYWEQPNEGASNSSGFTGLPGGRHYILGSFFDLGLIGFWWTQGVEVVYYALSKNSAATDRTSGSRFTVYKQDGYSVRCVKD